MHNFKETAPEYGDYIVWIVIERKTGHLNSGLSKHDENLEVQFLDESIDVFWTPGTAPAQARLSASIRAVNEELASLPKQQEELTERRNTFVEEYDAISAESY